MFILLLVKQLEEDLVAALKRRAARRGRSAEAEHREILRVLSELRKGARLTEQFSDRLLLVDENTTTQWRCRLAGLGPPLSW